MNFNIYVWFYEVKPINHYYYFVYDNNFIYEAGFTNNTKLIIHNGKLQHILVGIGIVFSEELNRYFNRKLTFFKSVKYVYELHRKTINDGINNKVYRYLTNNVKIGKVTTYNDIAKKFNIHPRYVGIIMKNNKTALLIPCHRVIKSDGSLGGYMGSNTFIKEFLLGIEGYIGHCRLVKKNA